MSEDTPTRFTDLEYENKNPMHPSTTSNNAIILAQPGESSIRDSSGVEGDLSGEFVGAAPREFRKSSIQAPKYRKFGAEFYQSNCCSVCIAQNEELCDCCLTDDRCTDCRIHCIPFLNQVGWYAHKLPCFDETDDGVPPFCRDPRCPFDHRNPYLYQNDCCQKWGNVGWAYFDRKRKIYMGIATIFTILAIVITTIGCFSLGSDVGMVDTLYWQRAKALNKTTGVVMEDVRIGLTSFNERGCTQISADGDECDLKKKDNIFFGVFILNEIEDDDCIDETNELAYATPLAHQICGKCRKAAVGMQMSALMSCASLIFALLGTMTRMRFIADAPVQKLLGAVTDSYGALSLIVGIVQFYSGCESDVKKGLSDFDIKYETGPALWLYAFCALAGIVRAIMHWLTPMPNQGAGACTWSLPTPPPEFKRQLMKMAHNFSDVTHEIVTQAAETTTNAAIKAAAVTVATATEAGKQVKETYDGITIQADMSVPGTDFMSSASDRVDADDEEISRIEADLEAQKAKEDEDQKKRSTSTSRSKASWSVSRHPQLPRQVSMPNNNYENQRDTDYL